MSRGPRCFGIISKTIIMGRSKIEECEKSPSETRVVALLVGQLCSEKTTETPANMYKLLDSYLLNAAMSTFPYRYKVLCAIRNLLAASGKASPTVSNMVTYLVKYYGEYVELHATRMKELQKPFSDKMMELIRIAKWDITNYYAFQSCIAHNHIQLMRIIKDFGDLLKMPFSTTVLTSNRERTLLSEQHVFALTQEPTAGKTAGPSPLQELVEEIHDRIDGVKETESKAARRRALIDLFKRLKAENVASRYKHFLTEGAEMLYQRRHLDQEAISKAVHGKAPEILQKSARYYFASLQNLNVMLFLPAFHEHLSTQEIEAMKGFAYNLVVRMSAYAEKLDDIALEVTGLRKLLRRFPSTLSLPTSVALKKTPARKELIEECVSLWQGSRRIALQLGEIHTKYGSKMPAEISERLRGYLDVCEKAEIIKTLEKDPVAYSTSAITGLEAEVTNMHTELVRLVATLRGNAEMVYGETTTQLERYGWIMGRKLALLHGAAVQTEAVDQKTKLEITSIISTIEERLNGAKAAANQTATIDMEESLLGAVWEVHMGAVFESTIFPRLEQLADSEVIAKAREMLVRVIQSLEHQHLARGVAHIHALSKCTHLITTVFANLLKNGFCIHDKPDDEDEAKKNKKMGEELDGMGLGEGQGRQDISEELQHEEQIEGTKGEKIEDQDAAGPEDKKELDKGFEMEEDFEGKLDDLGEEGKKEAEEKKEGDLQREMQEDMGKAEENKMWNDENELPIEDKKEEPEGKVQDLTEKKPQETKGETDTKAADDKAQRQQQQLEDDKGEGKPEEKKSETEEKKEFEEAEKDDEFHMEKNEEMEGLRSDQEEEKKEEEQKDEDGLSLSMNSEEPNPEEDKEDNVSSDKEGEEELKESEQPAEEKKEEGEAKEDAETGKLGEEQKEEDKKEDKEIPIAATAEQNPNAESMPYGNEEENQALAGESKNESNKEQSLYSKVDIAQVVNEQFNKSEAKKQERSMLKGKLGKNTDNKQLPNLGLTAPEDQKTEERKAMEGDEVVPKGENEETKKDEEVAQAVGETMMDIANENIANEPEQQEEQKDEPQKEQGASSILEKSTKTGKSNEQNRRPRNPEDDKKSEEKKEETKKEDEKTELPGKPEGEKKVEPAAAMTDISTEQKKKEEEKKETEKVVPWKEESPMTPEKYEEEKNEALRLYYQWLSVPEKASAASEMLQRFENLTRSLSASLCEQLRILLEPTQRTKLKGDYKTGTAKLCEGE